MEDGASPAIISPANDTQHTCAGHAHENLEKGERIGQEKRQGKSPNEGSRGIYAENIKVLQGLEAVAEAPGHVHRQHGNFRPASPGYEVVDNVHRRSAGRLLAIRSMFSFMKT